MRYGHPESGKTVLAKIVENQTTASVIRVVEPQCGQKYLDEVCLFAPLFTHFPYHSLSVIVDR